MNTCNHLWALPFREPDNRYQTRTCTVCGLRQKGTVKITWKDNGRSQEMLMRIAESKKKKQSMQYFEPDTEHIYRTYNHGLGETPTGKGDYNKLAKEKKAIPIGDQPLKREHNTPRKALTKLDW